MSKELTMSLLTATLLVGCANPPALEDAPRPPSMERAGNECDASALQAYVGQSHSDVLEQAMRDESQAQRLRTIHPNQGYTMDYRSDRLNIYLDEAGRIKRLSCG